MPGHVLSPKNCPFACGVLHSYLGLIHVSLSSPEPTTQKAFRLVTPFLHNLPQSVPILHNGWPLFALEISPSHVYWVAHKTIKRDTRLTAHCGFYFSENQFARLNCWYTLTRFIPSTSFVCIFINCNTKWRHVAKDNNPFVRLVKSSGAAAFDCLPASLKYVNKYAWFSAIFNVVLSWTCRPMLTL